MNYKFTRKELKDQKASDFEHGDSVKVSHYVIQICYNDPLRKLYYDRPSFLSWIEDVKTGGFLDCTPGAGTPYYVGDFLGR